MATYYTQSHIPHTYNFPLMVTEWSPVENVYTTPIVNIPVAVVISQLVAPVCPHTGVLCTAVSLMHTVPITGTDVAPLVCNYYNCGFDPELNRLKNTESLPIDIHPRPLVHTVNKTEEDVIPLISNNYNYNFDPEVNHVEESECSAIDIQNNQYFAVDVPKEINEVSDEIENKDSDVEVDPIELYLKLPKELFPKPNMLSINPNPIIDEFCMLENIKEHVSWILDLEFGVPRGAITRTIATYDVKFNSIHCKNTPNAIHPGFEKCNSDFKRVILFYYDCIVSNWYKGYIILKNDKSVDNFQSWLSKPMQMFGMCWL